MCNLSTVCFTALHLIQAIVFSYIICILYLCVSDEKGRPMKTFISLISLEKTREESVRKRMKLNIYEMPFTMKLLTTSHNQKQSNMVRVHIC